MNQPNSTSRPTDEALAMQAEWRQEPDSLAREEARRALELLSQAAATSSGQSTDQNLPALPDSLRKKWEDMCVASAPPPVSRKEQRREAAIPSIGSRFFQWLLQPRGLAVAGGTCALMLAAIFFLGQPSPVAGPEFSGNAPILTRGSETSANEEDQSPAPVWLVAPASLEEQAAGARSELARAFPGRDVQRVETSDAAMAEAELRPRLIVIDLATRTVTAWSGGELAGTFALGQESSVISRLEDADEKLNDSPATSR